MRIKNFQKITICLVVFYIAFLSFGVAEASKNVSGTTAGGQAKETGEIKSKYTFTIGDVTFPVLFEDEKSPDELKKVIIEDLNVIYGHNKKLDQYKAHKTVSIDHFETKVMTDQYLELKGPRPEDLRKEMIFIFTKKNKNYLVIQKSTIEIYKKALEFKKANKEVFDKLDQFFKNLVMLDSNSLSKEEKEAWVYFHESAVPYANDLDKFLQGIRNIKFRKISILDVKKYNDTSIPPESIMVQLYTVQDNKIQKWFMGIYHQNQWKIFLYAL